MEKKYKVGLISLGCAKNLVDSEMILGMLNSSNFEVVNSIEKSDVIIVNTCGFIEDSKKESIENILDVIAYNKVTVVTGSIQDVAAISKGLEGCDACIHIALGWGETPLSMLENDTTYKFYPDILSWLGLPDFISIIMAVKSCVSIWAICSWEKSHVPVAHRAPMPKVWIQTCSNSVLASALLKS